MQRSLVTWSTFLFASAAFAGTPQDVSDRYYSAIRDNDISTLSTLIQTADPNSKDKRGTTPLMYSAAVGSVESMRILLAAGADVNVKNAFEATALMWSVGDIEKVRMLVEKGADVNARSKPGRTPLLIAAASNDSYEVVKYLAGKGADLSAKDQEQNTALLMAASGNDTATIRLLLGKGADVNAKNAFGFTPLLDAAEQGNAEVVRLLLAKGADVNAVTAPVTGRPVKNGVIELGSFTPLLVAAWGGGAETVKTLLDAGANVNAQDVRGMTPLMLAIATDHPNVAVIKLLLAKGAAPALRSKTGETAMDWAAKYQYPPVLAALGMKSEGAAPVAMTALAASKPVPVRAAVQRSLSLLERSSGGFMKEGGCFACHAQNLTALPVSAARASGIPVNEAAMAEASRGVRLSWSSFDQMLLQRLDPPAGPDLLVFGLLQMSACGAEADRTTDAMVHNIASQQLKAGNWHLGGIARAPMEDGDFMHTALAIRALQRFAPAGRKPEFAERVGRAATWLVQAEARTTQDRTMQMLGLKWANSEPALVAVLAKDLMASQRADGGWAQTPELASDAYATGEVLYALHETGVPAADAAYRRGVEYLLRTQREDGSWYVKSRAPKFQPYFQSGFPHDHDQWISAAATAWAAAALSYAVDRPPEEARTGLRQD